jgi:carboxymethylenebutenolidase
MSCPEQEVALSELKIDVKGADGTAEAYLLTPSSGSGPWPGVLFLTDIMGIRKDNLGMAQRVADHGYTVLVPNIFYRVSKLPVVDFEVKFGDERTMKRMGELRAGLTNAQMGPDGAAYADALLAQKDVTGSKIGVVGYCFTGQMAVRTAAQVPDKIAVAASFHGGGLYTDAPDSPHLLFPKIKARLYFGHAIEDRSMPAEAIAKFEAALEEWPGEGESETYSGAHHGWTTPSHAAAYNEPQAERHYIKLFEAFDAELK